MKSRVAIIGISVNASGVENLHDFQEIIERGESTFGDLSPARKQDIYNRFGKVNVLKGSYLSRIDRFDNNYFNISEAEAERTDPEQRLALEATVRVVHNAGYAVDELKGASVGIFHTVAQSSYRYFFEGQNNLSFAANTPGMFGARIAGFFDWRGPVVGLDTSCSSSSTALYYACQSLENRECEMALVVSANLGVNIENPNFSTAIVSRSETCTPFDEAADGTLGGEGVFCLLLKRLPDAVSHSDNIHAVIYGAAINHNGGRAQSISAPSPDAQSDVIKTAWRDAGIDPGIRSFIEAHGTGTVLGDPIEFAGIAGAFGSRQFTGKAASISSIKGQIGHLNVAAGLAGIVRAALALKSKMLWPQAGLRKVNTEIREQNSPVSIQKELEYWDNDGKKRFAGVSSFGLTGTNVHFVLGEVGDEVPVPATVPGEYILPLNASSPELFRDIVNYLCRFLESNPDIGPQDLAFSVSKVLTNGRYRMLLSYRTVEELIVKMRLLGDVAPVPTAPERKLVIIIPELLNIAGVEAYLSADELVAKRFKALQAAEGLGKQTDSLLFQLAGIRELIQATMEPAAIVGLGSGRLVSQVLSGSLSIAAATQLMTNGLDHSVNEQRLIDYLNRLADSDDHVLCVLGNKGKGVDLIRQWSAGLHRNPVVFCDHTAGIYREAIKGLFELGISFKYDAYFVGGKYLGDLHLPIFEQKRFWPEVTTFNDHDEEEVPLPPAQELYSVGLITDKIRDIWRKNLKITEWANADDFFDLGGTSLLGLDILDQIERTFGIKVGYADIFDFSTVDAQVSLVKDRLAQNGAGSPMILEKEPGTHGYSDEEAALLYKAEIERAVRESTPIEKLDVKCLLLTGATGFLGIYILRSLLIDSNCQIVCLVRSDSDAMAFERLASRYVSYFPDKELDTSRVRVICGDICEEGLAMSESGEAVVEHVDMVLHAAAKVEHYGRAGLIHKINVDGTANLFNWARRKGIKYFNHCSTTVVASGTIANKKEIHFYESQLDVGQEITGDIYAKSKFEAESYLFQNRADMQLNVFRIGNIGGDSISGQFQKNIESNFLYQSLRLLADMRCYCDDVLSLGFDAMPVDIVANIVVGLSLSDNKRLNCFHIQNKKPLTINAIADAMNVNGVFIESVPRDEFQNSFNRVSGAPGYLESNFSAALYKWNEGNGSETKFSVEDELTKIYLSQLNVNYEYNLDLYFEKVLRYCLEIGFIADTRMGLNY